MPELPEVEIAARNLRSWLRKKTIDAVTISRTRVVRGGSAAKIAESLVGGRVTKVDRRGKWLRLTLEGGALLFSHLGMSGRWVKRAKVDEILRSERARLDLGSVSVRYVDPRMFGRLVLASADIDEWTSLGPDPLTDGVDAKVLEKALSKIRRSIKEALLDQRVLAGIGNIQATEALWRARIDPRAPAQSLEGAQVKALAKAMVASIEDTLAHEEGPEITYVEDAGAPNPFPIYGREGEPCPRCRTALVRIVQGGRATVFCTECQARQARPKRRAT